MLILWNNGVIKMDAYKKNKILTELKENKDTLVCNVYFLYDIDKNNKEKISNIKIILNNKGMFLTFPYITEETDTIKKQTQNIKNILKRIYKNILITEDIPLYNTVNWWNKFATELREERKNKLKLMKIKVQ